MQKAATGAQKPLPHPLTLNSPTQFLPSGPSSKPALQTHWKLPAVLTQRPWWQRPLLAMHSSMSGGEAGGQSAGVLLAPRL